MNSLRIAFAVFLLQSSAARPPIAAAPASVEGVVVDRVTGVALSGVVVELTGIVGTKVESYAATTGKDGKFILKNVLPGPGYWMVASRPVRERSYLPTIYGQRGLRGPGVQIALVPDQRLNDVRLAMTPTGTISGRLLDSKGKPIGDKDVHAVSPSYAGGSWAQATFEVASSGFRTSARANSKGEYRLTGLPPGQYYVSVGAPFLLPGVSQVDLIARPDNDAEGYFGSTYFPGTNDPWSASIIDLRAGGNVANRDFSLSQVRFRRIRGVVINDASGAAVSSAQVLMVPRDAPPDSRYTRTLQTSKGSFEVDRVVPGSYFIVAFANDAGRRLCGRISIEVGRDNLENVTLRVKPGFDISGRILIERPEGGATTEIARTSVTLRPNPPSRPGLLSGSMMPTFTLDMVSTMISEGGMVAAVLAVPAVKAAAESSERVTFRNVISWDYSVEVVPAREDSYVKSIRLGDLDILRDGLHVEARREGTLEIVIGTNAGTLDGRVISDRTEPAAGIRVILVPSEALRRRSDLYKSAWTDSAGRFHLTGIAPGDYTLFAWEEAEAGAWKHPEFLRLYEGGGTPVRVRERTTERIETRLIPPWF